MPADVTVVLDGWSCAATPAGSIGEPGQLAEAGLDWIDVGAPRTAAAALASAGRFTRESGRDFDADDWWYRCSFDRPDGDGWHLVVEGLATLGDVWLNGDHLLQTANMFRTYEADLGGRLAERNELVVRCAALAPQLASRRRPRPAWKAQLPSDQSLRWFRTTLYGRTPGWTPDIAPVGPWRPISLRRPADDLPAAVRAVRLTPIYDGHDGRVEAALTLGPRPGGPQLAEAAVHATLVVGDRRSPLAAQAGLDGDLRLTGHVDVPDATAWWPATHGDQPLVHVRLELEVDGIRTGTDLGHVGFRSVTFGPVEAPVLRWSDTEVFCRGAGWTPVDPIGLSSDPDELRTALTQLRDAGLNMVRVQGSFVYETDDFYDLCDELGLMVWQDLMLSVLDYPFDDPAFAAELDAELTELFDRLRRHPCMAVVCGGSEVLQQAAMLGRPLPPAADDFFHRDLPDRVADQLQGVPCVAGSPSWVGDAFVPDSGVAHYFGVGGYRRPVADARTTSVKFTSECLAFSAVPDDHSCDALTAKGAGISSARWRQGVPHDKGRAWDFEDVRDHYVSELTGVDPILARTTEPDHYLDLGRAAVAEAVGRTMTEWRRAGSSCHGALVIMGRDLAPGAGFGLVDVDGRPKSTWFAVRRTMQPVALLLTDEGLGGLAIEAVNDGPGPLSGTLTVRAFAGPNEVADGQAALKVEARSSSTLRADAVLGGFYDLTFAYRFGPRSIEAVAVDWQLDDGPLVSAVFLPGGLPMTRSDVGLAGDVRRLDDTTAELVVTTATAARCVLIDAGDAQLSDDAFDLEPGGRRTITVRSAKPTRISLRAVNGLQPVAAVVADG